MRNCATEFADYRLVTRRLYKKVARRYSLWIASGRCETVLAGVVGGRIEPLGFARWHYDTGRDGRLILSRRHVHYYLRTPLPAAAGVDELIRRAC